MDFEIFHSSSKGNLYRLRSDSGSLLLEAGVSIKRIKKCLNFQLSAISGALITHGHNDHSAASKDLLSAGVDIYMTEETANHIELENHHRLHLITPLKQFKIGAFTILPFPTEHDCPGSVGYLIGNGKDKMVFATDTFYVRYKFKDLTMIAVECNFSKETMAPDVNFVRKKRLYSSHFSLKNVKKFLLANDLSQVRAIYLLHLSSENSDPDYFQDEIKKTTGKPVYVWRYNG